MKKTSEEIMNEIKKIERLLRNLSDDDCQADGLSVNLGKLQAQKQERLDCYKKELDKWKKAYKIVGANVHLRRLMDDFVFELKQEIKILEGK